MGVASPHIAGPGIPCHQYAGGALLVAHTECPACPSRLQVKLGPSFFIPNGQIGSFGGVLPLRSMVRDRRDLFDVAAAGPLAGAAGV